MIHCVVMLGVMGTNPNSPGCVANKGSKLTTKHQATKMTLVLVLDPKPHYLSIYYSQITISALMQYHSKLFQNIFGHSNKAEIKYK